MTKAGALPTPAWSGAQIESRQRPVDHAFAAGGDQVTIQQRIDDRRESRY